jgi:hypothetical protein
MHNVPEAFVELRQREPMLHFGPDHPLERVAATKEVLHIADVRMTAGYQDGDQAHVTMVDVAGARTVLLVPMLKFLETTPRSKDSMSTATWTWLHGHYMQP